MADTTEILQSIIAAKSAEADRQQKAVELGLNSFFKAAELRNKGNDLDTLLKYGQGADLALKTGNKPMYDMFNQGITGLMSTKVIPSQLTSALTQPTQPQTSQDMLTTGTTTSTNAFGIPTGQSITQKPKALADQEQQAKDLQTAGDLRKELIANPLVKEFQSISDYANRIDSILSTSLGSKDNKSKAISDQTLVTMFNKMLDPNSVVRESEYARTPEGISALSRLQGFVEKINKGGAGITDKERKDIGTTSKQLLDSTGNLYNQQLSRYEDLASTYKVDKNAVLGGFSKYESTKKKSNNTLQIGRFQVEVS